MDRVKTFFKYAIWVVLFFIFSEVMISIGLNSTYKTMEIKKSDNNMSVTANDSQDNRISIEQAQATLVNGRIRGTVRNSGDEDLNGKYIKVDIFSERNVLLGSKYYEIQNLAKDATQPFEVFFKAQYAKYLKTSIVDEIPQDKLFDGDNIEFLQKDLSKSDIILAVLIALIIWG